MKQFLDMKQNPAPWSNARKEGAYCTDYCHDLCHILGIIVLAGK